MMRLKIRLDGEPLAHTFVTHTPDFANPTVVLTDAKGTAAIKGVKPTDKIDVVVHAHNLAVRMLDGTRPGVVELSLRFRNKSDGDVCNITTADKNHFEHFVIMDRCYQVYETIFRPIPPFTGTSRRRFPYGGSGKEPHELKRALEVDCRFPEKVSPGRLPWVQPQSIITSVPLMHLKPQSVDKRLFGTANRKPTSIPHEYAHAMHFASMPRRARVELALRYGAWIAKELLAGRSGTHRTDLSTAPLIAFVESIGIFSQRFWLFATEVEPELRGPALRKAFVSDELSDTPSLAGLLPNYKRVATRTARGKIEPRLTGQKVEGAVYGAIFLDFANRTSLSNALNLYLRCHGFSYGDYASFASKQRSGAYRNHLRAVGKTWQM